MADKTRSEDPAILYHYTDATGLLGIVRSPQFPAGWEALDFSRSIKLQASDVRFMNDHAELRFAGKLFAEEFIEFAKRETVSAPQREVLLQLAEELNDAEFYAEPVQVFAACLSTNGDQLSQWRGYAGGTGGYSIGIRRHVLERFTYPLGVDPSPSYIETGILPQPAMLRKVVYGETEARKAAINVASGVQPTSGTLAQNMNVTFAGLWNAVGEMARFKDEGFREEQEWRLTHWHAYNNSRSSVPTEFRQGRFGIVPYLSIAINAVTPLDQPNEPMRGPRPERTIERLIVGPSPDQSLRVTAARQLLETCGHDPSVVVPSSLPFRG